MVTVEKNGITTKILEVFKEKYLSKGWKVIEKPKEEAEDEVEKIIKENLNSNKSARNRKRNIIDDKEKEAKVIVTTEIRKNEEKNFTDNLIKE